MILVKKKKKVKKHGPRPGIQPWNPGCFYWGMICRDQNLGAKGAH